MCVARNPSLIDLDHGDDPGQILMHRCTRKGAGRR